MNTDRLQTVLGLIEAALISAASFLYAAMSDPAGFNWKAPLFWMGLTTAVIRGVKGYYAAGVKVPTAVLALLLLPLSACTTVHKNADGTFDVPRATAVRGPLGTNYMTGKLQRCNAPAERGWAEPFYTDPESYTSCQDILDWQAFSSTGQGFQAIEGALLGTGIGLAGKLAGGASASSSASQSVTVAPAAATKGHH